MPKTDDSTTLGFLMMRDADYYFLWELSGCAV